MTPRERDAHLPAERLRALAQDGAARAAERRHLSLCAACSAELGFLHLAAAGLTTRARGECPAAERLLGHAQGALPDAAEAEAVEEHLTGCIVCAEIVERSQRADGAIPELPTAAVPRARPSLVARLKELVRFEMPGYTPALARGTGTVGAAALAEAMEPYRRGSYADTLERLERARATAAPPELDFFAGVCELHEGQIEAARASLARAVKARPRLAVWRWYHAQALLACGEGSEALRALRRAASLPGPYRELAATLAKRVAGALGDGVAPGAEARGRRPRRR